MLKKIDLNTLTSIDFAIEESVNELNEIVVTGLSRAAEKNRTPTPISTIPPSDLIQYTSTNIIDTLASQPGVDQITTDSGISNPVIKGLGYNRVVTINHGIRQEGQQWKDEHDIEIDEFSVYKIEILKGPARLTYGSDAMAGVINMISAPTLPEGKISGNLLANYQSNNGLITYSANISGNKKGVIWNLRYSNKRAHAYQNKYDGYVLNSGYKENILSGIAGLNKFWGYALLHWSVYDFSLGIIEGERDSATGLFIKHVAINDSTENVSLASGKDYAAYTAMTPFQKIQHSKIVLNNSFILGNRTLKTILEWQQNKR